MSGPQLDPAMRKLAERVASIRPPAEMEVAVMADFDRAHRPARRSPLRFVALAGALAASLVIAALLLRPAPTTAVPAEAFYPIPYTPPLQPYERVLVVERSVPVSELIAAGFRIQTSDPGASVRADIMVSQDGRPRAIRPIAFNLGGVR